MLRTVVWLKPSGTSSLGTMSTFFFKAISARKKEFKLGCYTLLWLGWGEEWGDKEDNFAWCVYVVCTER